MVRGTEPVARITLVPGDDRLRTVVQRNADGATRTERSGSVEHFDVAALAHRCDAANETADDALFARLGPCEVDRSPGPRD